jgi:hypothetical protein
LRKGDGEGMGERGSEREDIGEKRGREEESEAGMKIIF